MNDAYCDAINNQKNGYSSSYGLNALRQAIAFDETNKENGGWNCEEGEVYICHGVTEALQILFTVFLNPGDIALVPDPGYPVYSVGTWFAGGECHWMPLLEENGWLPDLDAIPPDVAARAKVMWLNYPNNPTGALASAAYFAKVVEFARTHDIAVLHDASYTEVSFDSTKPISFLQTPGAIDVGMEFHSLSKSYNMTGWRLGLALGNPEMINALMIIKSNLDSGVPQAIQHMGIEALKSSDSTIEARNDIYQHRRDRVVEVLQNIGLEVDPPKAGLYVWARIPHGYTSAQFTTMLLEQKNIVVTPGTGYGEYGEGYIRLSLTISNEHLEKGLASLSSLEIPKFRQS